MFYRLFDKWGEIHVMVIIEDLFMLTPTYLRQNIKCSRFGIILKYEIK